MTLFAAARLFNTQIRVIGDHDILIGDGNNGCLVLGHIADEFHYVSLRAIKGKSLGVD